MFREIESLEEYISHDTRQLFVEKERYNDILSRILPPSLSLSSGADEGDWAPVFYDNVTLMLLRVCNMTAIVEQCTPTEAVEVRQQNVDMRYKMSVSTGFLSRHLNIKNILAYIS